MQARKLLRIRDPLVRNGGFTLLELVIVIGVMAILALAMVPNLRSWQLAGFF